MRCYPIEDRVSLKGEHAPFLLKTLHAFSSVLSQEKYIYIYIYMCVCVCVCVRARARVFVIYEYTNLYNDMGMT